MKRATSKYLPIHRASPQTCSRTGEELLLDRWQQPSLAGASLRARRRLDRSRRARMRANWQGRYRELPQALVLVQTGHPGKCGVPDDGW